MYKIITDTKEKENILLTFSHNVKISSLKEYVNKTGYGDDFMDVLFKKDLEEDLYSYQQELKEIQDNQVVIHAYYPATISDSKDAEEVLYLNFDEFYNYLVEVVDKRIVESPEDKEEYQELLEKVKATLEL
ncbi:hypothetical protein [Lactococcus chungangensis]|uniref:hypothetical protein n=1 Tax=Pseudolactococcus chungangensis TaxID=451457 RepID=UPI0037370952